MAQLMIKSDSIERGAVCRFFKVVTTLEESTVKPDKSVLSLSSTRGYFVSTRHRLTLNSISCYLLPPALGTIVSLMLKNWNGNYCYTNRKNPSRSPKIHAFLRTLDRRGQDVMLKLRGHSQDLIQLGMVFKDWVRKMFPVFYHKQVLLIMK